MFAPKTIKSQSNAEAISANGPKTQPPNLAANHSTQGALVGKQPALRISRNSAGCSRGTGPVVRLTPVPLGDLSRIPTFSQPRLIRFQF